MVRSLGPVCGGQTDRTGRDGRCLASHADHTTAVQSMLEKRLTHKAPSTQTPPALKPQRPRPCTRDPNRQPPSQADADDMDPGACALQHAEPPARESGLAWWTSGLQHAHMRSHASCGEWLRGICQDVLVAVEVRLWELELRMREGWSFLGKRAMRVSGTRDEAMVVHSLPDPGRELRLPRTCSRGDRTFAQKADSKRASNRYSLLIHHQAETTATQPVGHDVAIRAGQ